jgi:hypothetical protein
MLDSFSRECKRTASRRLAAIRAVILADVATGEVWEWLIAPTPTWLETGV